MASKKYRVTGTATVLGHAPGTIFDADLPRSQEAPLIEIGALAVVSHRDEKPKQDKKEK